MSWLRARFQQVPGQHRPHPVRNGVIFVSLLAFALYCGFSKSIPFLPDGRKEITAHFDSVPNANTGNRVRVKGVDVGEITKIERHASGEGALVTMRVEEDGFDVRQDARAAVYWRTLLGRNMYVELEPGSKDAPELSGTIPLSRTESQVEFDQLLDSYDADGRRGVRNFFGEFERALDGDAAGEAIENAAPGLAPVAPAMRALRGRNAGRDLPALVDSGGKALAALAADEEALAGVLDGADTTFGVLAARSADMAAILEESPAAMRDARTTMARVRRTLDELDPLADDLRPGVRRLDDAAPPARRALDELRRLTPVALPALRDLEPALTRLGVAADEGTPFLRGLAPTLDRMKDEIVPFLDSRDDTTELRTVEAIGPFFGVLADSSSQFDAFGHMQRFQAGQGERTVASLPCNTGLFDPENPEQLLRCQGMMSMLPRLIRGGQKGGGADRAIARSKRGGK